jgi:hypothetical protein
MNKPAVRFKWLWLVFQALCAPYKPINLYNLLNLTNRTNRQTQCRCGVRAIQRVQQTIAVGGFPVCQIFRFLGGAGRTLLRHHEQPLPDQILGSSEWSMTAVALDHLTKEPE